ncbi:MAG: inositol monophosphatase [Candidatus Eremiobacteraeota bacterium]|nr:inositol monophosphatase [Candidatus Eremiobacteraeota bacterium]MBC5828023.1 inositol monophosphatase [Candidatus Eremiobacteraeota bacterium]
MISDRLAIAEDAARLAGALLRDRLGTDLHARAKDISTNLVTEADTASETLIRQVIASELPEEAVLGEEQGEGAGLGGRRWIVDPLDGTTNYAHGYRCFCVSIAYEEDGVLQLGVVYDPMAGEMFRARRGKGADCNGRALQVSDCRHLRDALLVTGFPAHDVSKPLANLGPFADFMRQAQALRRDGSAALDLCYVAAGRMDGFWEPGLHAWDIAAGALIVEEAGGRTSDYRGGPLVIDGEQIVASNGRIHDDMLGILRPHA